ncbi:MAG TPA: PQQ-binding-like beta-propeller repeat protein, partial [Planctomycetota bacterium]|nr:PQQ-binding-like beta-propeller repeat protein [Planctomycetota bacterium]
VNASNPVVCGNLVFISASYDTGGAMLEIQPDMSCKKLWATDELGTHFGTSLVADGILYGFDGRHQQNAQLTALHADDGSTLWRKQLQWIDVPKDAGARPVTLAIGRGALIRADGAFLCLGERGDLAWLELSAKECKELSRTKLFDAPETWCPPVISRGLLYICQNHTSAEGKPSRLLCYDLRDSGLAVPDSDNPAPPQGCIPGPVGR